MSSGTHKPAEAMHQIAEPQAEALLLADECEESATHWAHEIDTRAKAAKMLRAQHARIAELEDDLQFVERWAVHHGSKPSISAEEALSCIQHYPAIHEITKSYKDGKRPDTFNPYARIAELESQLEAIGAGGVEPLAADHPDDAAVDALAALMKAKLAKQRAKGYGGWNDKTQCPQQRLSDMLRAHVDKGDPVDVANFCAMLSARGEGIAAAPQAVQPAVPEGWKLAPIKVPDSAFAWVSGGYPAGFKAGDKRDTAVVHERAQRTWEAILNGITAPAHPAEGVPAQAAAPAPDERAAFEAWLGIKPCGAAHDFGWAAWRARAALAATQPAAQGMDAQDAKRYRWLRECNSGSLVVVEITGTGDEDWHVLTEADADAAIDAALAAQAKQGGAA